MREGAASALRVDRHGSHLRLCQNGSCSLVLRGVRSPWRMCLRRVRSLTRLRWESSENKVSLPTPLLFFISRGDGGLSCRSQSIPIFENFPR